MDDPLRCEEEPDAGGLGIIVLRDQSLITLGVPRAHPALERERLEFGVRGQSAFDVNVGTGMNGLRRRLRLRKLVKHDVLVEIVDVAIQPADA